MKLAMLFVLVFVIGILVGYLIFRYRLWRKIPGTLRIDYSDPDGPYLFLELRESPSQIVQKKYIALLVDARDYTQD